jgi:hypothetical protein
VNVEQMTHSISAGILPITRDEHGSVLFLIGKDVRDNAYSDFGGKCEKVDHGDPVNTAIREFYEETLGCVCNKPYDIKYRLINSSVMLKGETRNKNEYRMFVMEIPYNKNINDNFVKTMNFLKYKNIGTNMIEKKELTWVTYQELMKIPKRTVFETTLMKNISLLRRIAAEPWKDICDNVHVEPKNWSPTFSRV